MVRFQRSRCARVAAAGVVALLAVGGCSSDADDGSSAEPAGQSGDGGEGASLTSETVDASFDELDQIVADVMEESGVPGVAVAVVYDDEVVYEQGYGVRSVDGDDPVTPDTVFQIASLSKPLSSTVMAGLVGQGVFEWDDPIHDYAPQFELSDPWVTEHVTFADLFAHRSGLPGGPAGNYLEAIGYDRDTILPRLVEVPLEPFRDTYSYSNFGMTLGGEAAAVPVPLAEAAVAAPAATPAITAKPRITSKTIAACARQQPAAASKHAETALLWGWDAVPPRAGPVTPPRAAPQPGTPEIQALRISWPQRAEA